MTIILVRHAIAMARRDWNDADTSRPLTSRGQRQATRLVDRLTTWPVDRVCSSPAARCIETVRPLAEARGLAVEVEASLDEGTGTRGLALATSADNVVLCAHGDNLPELLLALAGHLEEIDDPLFQKAGAWVLDRKDGVIVDAIYLSAPV